MKKSVAIAVAIAEKPQQKGVVQYTKFNVLGAQQQPVLPRFVRCTAVLAQVNAQRMYEKLTQEVNHDIMVSRRSQGFGDLESLCKQVVAEGSSYITGFILAKRGEDCVQFCCLVGGHPQSFPLSRGLVTPCDNK